MIWASDKTGKVFYISPEWTSVTGQDAASALGDGWLEAIHPHDRDKIFVVFKTALRAQQSFGITYRLRQSNGTYEWVAAGAVASHGPPGAAFLGFLGSVTTISPEMGQARGSQTVGHFSPPPPHPHTMPHGLLDLLADHLIIAHSCATEDGGKTALPFIAQALAAVGMELARATRLQ